MLGSMALLLSWSLRRGCYAWACSFQTFYLVIVGQIVLGMKRCMHGHVVGVQNLLTLCRLTSSLFAPGCVLHGCYMGELCQSLLHCSICSLLQMLALQTVCLFLVWNAISQLPSACSCMQIFFLANF